MCWFASWNQYGTGDTMGRLSAAAFMKRNILFPLKLLIGLFCVAGFGYQISFILDQFINRETNTSIDYIQHEKMPLPVVSVCSSVPFKANLNSTGEEEYLAKTHAYAEMFDADDNREKKWNFTEFRSYLMGRCYSFRTNKSVPSVSLDEAITIRHKYDLNVYVHQEEEEFWLWYLLTPVGFGANTIPHTGNVDLHLNKKVVTILKREDNCYEYEDVTLGFTRCAEKKIRNLVVKSINCTTHALKWLLGPELSVERPMCTDMDAVAANNQQAGNTVQEFTQTPGKHGCSLPCSRTKYLTRTNHFPEPQANESDPVMRLFIYYDSLLVESQREVLVYDIPGFLSAAGGTLGLYLGFSIFSILVGLIKMTFNKKDKKMEDGPETPPAKKDCRIFVKSNKVAGQYY